MQQKTKLFSARAAMMLLMMMFTATTAWADDPDWLLSGDSWDDATKTLTINSTEMQKKCVPIPRRD